MLERATISMTGFPVSQHLTYADLAVFHEQERPAVAFLLLYILTSFPEPQILLDYLISIDYSHPKLIDSVNKVFAFTTFFSSKFTPNTFVTYQSILSEFVANLPVIFERKFPSLKDLLFSNFAMDLRKLFAEVAAAAPDLVTHRNVLVDIQEDFVAYNEKMAKVSRYLIGHQASNLAAARFFEHIVAIIATRNLDTVYPVDVLQINLLEHCILIGSTILIRYFRNQFADLSTVSKDRLRQLLPYIPEACLDKELITELAILSGEPLENNSELLKFLLQLVPNTKLQLVLHNILQDDPDYLASVDVSLLVHPIAEGPNIGQSFLDLMLTWLSYDFVVSSALLNTILQENVPLLLRLAMLPKGKQLLIKLNAQLVTQRALCQITNVAGYGPISALTLLSMDLLGVAFLLQVDPALITRDALCTLIMTGAHAEKSALYFLMRKKISMSILHRIAPEYITSEALCNVFLTGHHRGKSLCYLLAETSDTMQWLAKLPMTLLTTEALCNVIPSGPDAGKSLLFLLASSEDGIRLLFHVDPKLIKLEVLHQVVATVGTSPINLLQQSIIGRKILQKLAIPLINDVLTDEQPIQIQPIFWTNQERPSRQPTTAVSRKLDFSTI